MSEQKTQIETDVLCQECGEPNVSVEQIGKFTASNHKYLSGKLYKYSCGCFGYVFCNGGVPATQTGNIANAGKFKSLELMESGMQDSISGVKFQYR